MPHDFAELTSFSSTYFSPELKWTQFASVLRISSQLIRIKKTFLGSNCPTYIFFSTLTILLYLTNLYMTTCLLCAIVLSFLWFSMGTFTFSFSLLQSFCTLRFSKFRFSLSLFIPLSLPPFFFVGLCYYINIFFCRLRIRKRCIRPTHDIRSERALNLLHWNAITNCIRALRKKTVSLHFYKNNFSPIV